MNALELLHTRVSENRLVEPAPDAAQREALFRAALRVPDHGWLRPWRFVCVEGEARHRLGDLLAAALLKKDSTASSAALERARSLPLRAPLLVVVVARLHSPRQPEVEQLLSAGCAAHALVLAAHALELGAIWRTGELSYDPHVMQGLGLDAQERIVGFVYLGTIEGERRSPPVLDVADFVSDWTGA